MMLGSNVAVNILGLECDRLWLVSQLEMEQKVIGAVSERKMREGYIDFCYNYQPLFYS